MFLPFALHSSSIDEMEKSTSLDSRSFACALRKKNLFNEPWAYLNKKTLRLTARPSDNLFFRPLTFSILYFNNLELWMPWEWEVVIFRYVSFSQADVTRKYKKLNLLKNHKDNQHYFCYSSKVFMPLSIFLQLKKFNQINWYQPRFKILIDKKVLIYYNRFL